MVNRLADAVSIERETYEATIAALRERVARLQHAVDSTVDAVLNRIVVANTVAAAESLVVDFDETWFRECLFSPKVKKAVAEALIGAVKHYPWISAFVWQKVISEGNR
jgi:hypothetical protein